MNSPITSSPMSLSISPSWRINTSAAGAEKRVRRSANPRADDRSPTPVDPRTAANTTPMSHSLPPGGPWGALVAGRRYPASVLEQARHVQQVPGHERGVAVRETVLGSAGTGIEIGRAGPRLADPPRVGLRRHDVTEMLQRVEDVHG